MIQAHITGSGFRQSGGFIGSVKRVIALIAALGIGALVLFAAGVVAIATALVGLIIAFVAMLLRLGVNRPAPSVRTGHKGGSEPSSEDGVLEARRTARGWTVDG